MNNTDVLFDSSIPELPMIGRGKVRDIYGVDDDHLLIVTTDRLSAYDVVLPDPIPGKGAVLTKISLFWFEMMADIIDNQLTSLAIDDVVKDTALCDRIRDQSLVVKRLEPLPIEAVVRGYLIGSGWRDYQDTQQVCGIDLPRGLRQAEKLPATLFTPASKADAGDHDENISYDTVVEMIGENLASRVRDVSIQIYERAAAYVKPAKLSYVMECPRRATGPLHRPVLARLTRLTSSTFAFRGADRAVRARAARCAKCRTSGSRSESVPRSRNGG